MSRFFQPLTRLFNASSSTSPPTMVSETVKKLVDSSISDNKVVIFSKSYCPYCKKAKGLFASSYPDVKTIVYELDERSDGGDIQDYLEQKSGQRTVPNIFINQEHIGGSSDLLSLDSKGQLAPKLNE